MNGLEGACRVVAEHLAAALPGKTAELRTRLAVTNPIDLPDVALVLDHDEAPIPLEGWPAVMVVGQNLESMIRHEVAATGTDWLCTYRLRVFVWSRGDSFPHTDHIRKRLTLAVREVLMQQRKITAAAHVDDKSLTESYSDLDVDDAGATIAGAFLELNLVTLETLGTVPTKGVADDLIIDTGTIPPHPAL